MLGKRHVVLNPEDRVRIERAIDSKIAKLHAYRDQIKIDSPQSSELKRVIDYLLDIRFELLGIKPPKKPDAD